MICKFLPVLATVALLLSGSAAPADEVSLPVTLDFLVDDPNDPTDDADAFILSPTGRFRFSEFTYSPVATNTTPPEETEVQVEISESGNSVSLAFEILENGTVANVDAAFELTLEYLAEVIDPGLAFRSHTLTMDAETPGEQGTVVINEEILVPGVGGLGNVTTLSGLDDQVDRLSDSVLLAPTRRMTIHNKDISVSSNGAEGFATLTRFEQTFQVIPEPSSFVLMGLGMMGLGMTARRLQHV